jgi:hypothetical protein
MICSLALPAIRLSTTTPRLASSPGCTSQITTLPPAPPPHHQFDERLPSGRAAAPARARLAQATNSSNSIRSFSMVTATLHISSRQLRDWTCPRRLQRSRCRSGRWELRLQGRARRARGLVQFARLSHSEWQANPSLDVRNELRASSFAFRPQRGGSRRSESLSVRAFVFVCLMTCRLPRGFRRIATWSKERFL